MKKYKTSPIAIITILSLSLFVMVTAGNAAIETNKYEQMAPVVETDHFVFLPIVLGSNGSNQTGSLPSTDDQPGDPLGDLPANLGTGFEVDGNTPLDMGGEYDWENADYPPAVLLPDPNSKATQDPTTFKPDGKFDEPKNWKVNPGIVGPPQTELTNLAAWLVAPNSLPSGGPSDSWLILGMERTKKEGTFFLDFEFNQIPWDGSDGGPTRTPGDIVVGFALKGNPTDRQKDLEVLFAQYSPGIQPALCSVVPGPGNKPALVEVGSDPCPPYGDSGWYYRYLADGAILADSGLGEATMNEQPFSPPWPSTDAQGNSRDIVGSFQFAEASFNLNELGIELSCSKFSSVHAKGRASLEPTSDLKDLAGPSPLGINCRLDGHKFLDVNGNGAWDKSFEVPLEGWEIKLSNGETAYTDANGFYEFENLFDGTYSVNEVCPEGWVQTMPGFSNFDDCGLVPYTVDIDIQNNHVTDLDFGNGQPNLDVSKRCPADAFLGDDVEYEILVTNSGNVELYDIEVQDSLIGSLGNISNLPVGESWSTKVKLNATAEGEMVNQVTASGKYGASGVTVSGNDSCSTNIHGLIVTKNAQTSLIQQPNWTITKSVDGEDATTVVLLVDQTVSVDYEIVVDLGNPAYTESGWVVKGNITIENPAPMAATLTKVTDVLSGNINAPVDCPSLTVPAGGTLTCTYGPVELPDNSPRTNTATAFLQNNQGGTTEFKGAAPVDFSSASIEIIDEEVTIEDNRKGILGTVNVNEVPKTFKYSEEFGPIPLESCNQNSQVINKATFTTIDTGTTGWAEAVANLICLASLTTGFEDLPLDQGNDWDYNDLVVDIRLDPKFSKDNDLTAITFFFQQPVNLSAYTHQYHIQPTVFACNGTYSLRRNGVPVISNAAYKNGDDLLIFTNTGNPTNTAELTINFNVPTHGECPLNVSGFDPINTFHGEGLFFVPWVKVNNTGEKIMPGDPRLLGVPIDWKWPAEKQAIWQVYPDVSSPLVTQDGPIFKPIWWDNYQP
jgi:uncharacterized repeat protein (TIGR01451 family)